MKVAICVGHSRDGDDGAESVSGITEWAYNDTLAGFLKEALRLRGIESEIIDHYKGKGYSAAMRDAAAQVANYGADIALELHFNSADSSANGFEYLFWHSSNKGARLAASLISTHAKNFSGFKNRGPKPIDANDRGGSFLRLTPCPAVICEPFFGSNDREWNFYSINYSKLAEAYADAIVLYKDGN